MPRISLVRYLLLAVVFTFSALAQAALVDVDEHNGVAYFTFAAPNKIVRYDMSSETFLPEVTLSNVPTATGVGDGVIVVAYHRNAYRINPETLTSTFIGNTSVDIQDVLIVNGYAYLSKSGSEIDIYNLSSGSRVEIESLWYGRSGMVASEGQSSLYYRTTGVSPSDIHKLTLSGGGNIIGDIDSPYHGDFPSASQLYMFPDDSRVLDDQGIVYFAEDLSYAGSVAGAFDDMTFWQGDLLLRRGSQLLQYSPQLLETGELTLSNTPVKLLSHEDRVFAFFENASAISAEVVDTSELQASEPNAPLDPSTLAYEPDFLEFDSSNGLLYFVDRESLGVFAWSVEDEAYTRSLSLQNPPSWVTYSPAHHRLYLGYSSGRITYFDMTLENPVETGFVNLPQAVLGLKSAGSFLFAADISGAWNRHYSFNSVGTLIDSAEWRNVSSEYLWNPETERIYHFRDGMSPNDIEWAELLQETGTFGADGDSPYHGDSGFGPPLRLDPEGQLILTGYGRLYDALTLNELNSLSNNISDAAWLGSGLFTIRRVVGNSYLQSWSSSYELEVDQSLESDAEFRLFASSDELVMVELAETGPVVTLMTPTGDSDADGVIDILDNCPQVANANQANLDSDRYGNVCDTDVDNDGIPNSVESSVGLDQLDASDAGLDLDGDGFSNRDEYRWGTGINDPDSVPPIVRSYADDFESGVLSDVYTEGSTSSAPWYIDSSRSSGGTYSLRSGSIDYSQSSVLALNQLFVPGALSFDLYTGAEGCCDYLEVWVDGVLRFSGQSYSQNWDRVDVSLEEGAERIEFVYVNDNYYSDNSSIWIDNLAFEAYDDGDGDDIWNHQDNCPSVINSEQQNLDSDEMGDACDDDQDGDGVSNEIEDEYEFLDPRNPSDGARDFDDDGVSNVDEIKFGYDPGHSTEFPLIDMTPYFPLGEITWYFEGGNTIVSSREGNSNRFRFDYGGWIEVYEWRDDGIYLLQEGDEEDSYVYVGGLLAVPSEMRVGDSYEHSLVIQARSSGEIVFEREMNQRIRINTANSVLGEHVEQEVIALENTFLDENDQIYSNIELLAKDVGRLRVYGSFVEDYEIRGLADSPRSDEDEDSGGGGGAISWELLVLLMPLLFRRRTSTSSFKGSC